MILDAMGKPAHTPKQVTMRDAQGRLLYAVDVLLMVAPGTWRHRDPPLPVFATDAHDARKQVSAILARKARPFRIMGAGPAIGFFVHDDNADSCSYSPRNRALHVARSLKKEG